MTQELHIPNLNTLIAHLEAQPPERINMYHVDVRYHLGCGTCGCIAGHANLLGSNGDIEHWLNLNPRAGKKLIMPPGYCGEERGARRYPAHRVISTLKRLRDHYLATGEVVVDWGPEPTAPQATDQLTALELPEELTRLLAPKSETVEADHG